MNSPKLLDNEFTNRVTAMPNSISKSFLCIRKMTCSTQSEMGKRLGLTRATISTIENAERDNDVTLECSYKLFFFAQCLLDDEDIRYNTYIEEKAKCLKDCCAKNILAKL